MPNHDDANPSVLIEYKKGRNGFPTLLAWCRSCKASLDGMCEAVGVEVHRVMGNNGTLDRELGLAPRSPAPLPTPADLAAWRLRLGTDLRAMAYLHDTRGLTFQTVRRYGIGHDGDRYTLPVFEGGRLVNLRRYRPGVATGKMRGLAGRTSKNLFPSLPDASWVLLCEGEWDALLARQNRLPAVTSTAGVDGWHDGWNELLRDRDVAIAFDCQDVSQRAAVRRAEGLRGIARVVKVVDLGLGHKEDITDWFVTHGRDAVQLREVIKATAVFA